MKKQRAKESACFIAVRNGFGLIRRGAEIHKIFPIGTTELLCSGEYKDLWEDAYNILCGIYGVNRNKEKATPLIKTSFSNYLI